MERTKDFKSHLISMIAIFIFLILAIGSTEDGDMVIQLPPDPDDPTTLILGTWKGTMIEEGYTGTMQTKFTKDKKFSQVAKIKAGMFEYGPYRFAGEWDVVDEILIMKYTESSGDLFPPGYTASSEIMNISKDRAILKEDGKVITYEKILTQ